MPAHHPYHRSVSLMLPADEDPCDHLAGPAHSLCESDKGGGGGAGVTEPPDTLDPLATLAQEVARAADWTARELGKVVADRDTVDFTATSFVAQYAVVFAASTVLVLVLWLLAVAKRAIRGVPMTTAMGEAIGLLWIAVGAVAFTPLILYTLTAAVSAVTDAMVAGFGSTPGGLFNELGANLRKGDMEGGPILLMVASLLTIALCGALWLLLVMRALALYVGAVLGVVVYSGLVDKDLWGRVRRWAGGMVMLILVEPVIVIVLGLAAALQSNGAEGGPIVTGIGVTAVALGAAIYVIWKFPGFGDSIQVARAVARTTVGGAARAVSGGTSTAAANVRHGIDAHASRTPGQSRSSTPRPSNPVTGGISAHGQREHKKGDGPTK